MILIGSIIIIAYSLWCMYNLGHVSASELGDASDAVRVATAGDVGFQTQARTLTDVYNVECLQLFLLLFWMIWNVIRTVYRVLTDFKKW